MKVLFFARSLSIGGAERQLVVTAKELRNRGHDVKVMVFYGKGALETELEKSDVQIINLDKRGRWDTLLFFWKLLRQLSFERPDVIYSYLNVPNILSAVLKIFFPGTAVVWGVRASDMDLSKYDWLSRFGYQIECKLSRFVDLIISNSYAGRDYAVLNGFPEHSFIVIPNGMDDEKFQFSNTSRLGLRAEFGINENDLLIGIVARLDPMKDHPTFFKAAAALKKDHKNIKFLVVGDGAISYKQSLAKLVQDLNLDKEVIWAGSRKDMPQIYSSLDILISSSLFGEGFSNAIAEAMLTGVPCVATDVGDSAILVKETGKVIHIASPEELSDAVKKLIADLSPDLRTKTRHSISSRFSTDKMVDKTLAALQKAVKIKK